MAYASLGNPIWSGQGQLLGGVRKLATSSMVFAVILMVAFVVMRRIQHDLPTSAVAGRALVYLSWIQWASLLVGGTAAVLKALVRDQQTRMIESLRLAPISGLSVVAGYALGPALSVLAHWAVGFVFGVGLILLGGAGDVRDWTMGHLLVLLVALLVWNLQVFLGVGTGKPAAVVIPLLIACFVLSMMDNVIRFMPGFALFVGGHLAFASRAVAVGGQTMDRALAVSLFATVVMVVFWSYAVGARFRRPYLPALSVGAALTLVVLWAGCNIVGLRMVGGLYSQPIAEGSRQIMGLVVMHALIVFGCLPVSSAAQVRRRTLLGGAPIRWGDGWPPVIAASLSALLTIGALVLVARESALPAETMVLPGAVGVVSAVLLALGVLKISCLIWERTPPGWAILVVLWGAPLLISPIWDAVAEELQRPRPAASHLLFVSSPAGGLISIARGDDWPVWWGWPVQLGLAGAVLLFAHRVERRFLAHRRVLRASDGAQAP